MAEIEDRVGKLEKTFARLTGGAIVAGVALLIFFGITYRQIPNKVQEILPGAITSYVEKQYPGFDDQLLEFLASAETAADDAEQVAGDLRTLLDQFRSSVIDSGTITPADWERFESGGTYGIRADVSVDLSGIHQPKIFLSRRGNSHIWETQGLSAYPLSGQDNAENRWERGFRVLVHAGALQHREDDQEILTRAQEHHWYVDWLVIGNRGQNLDK